jgi:hypothetical protein
MLLINFYAKRHKEINEECKEVSVVLPTLSPLSNERILSSILELTDYAEKIDYGGLVKERKR